MTAASWLQVLALAAALLVGTRYLGAYLANVFGDGPDGPGRASGRSVTGSSTRSSGSSTASAASTPSGSSAGPSTRSSVLAFSLVSVLCLYAMLRLQGSLPLNPTASPACPRRSR